MADICMNPDCEYYPYYGLAPHKYIPVDVTNFLNPTLFLPKEEWPNNFVPDPEDETAGTWYCPRCLKDKK